MVEAKNDPAILQPVPGTPDNPRGSRSLRLHLA
jgi:hypothetical protein